MANLHSIIPDLPSAPSSVVVAVPPVACAPHHLVPAEKMPWHAQNCVHMSLVMMIHVKTNQRASNE